MVDVTPGDSGANKGFWRKQLRDRYGRFVEMGGSVLFELDLPGVDGIIHATGTFVGMLDLETARVEVPDDSRVPKGIYLVKRDKLSAVMAKLPKSYVDQKAEQPSFTPPATNLKSSISGDEALKIRMKSVARHLKEKGRFPIPRIGALGDAGKDTDIANGAKLDYQKVFDSSPEVKDRFKTFENMWDYVAKNGTNLTTQSPNDLNDIPEDMKLLNRAYAEHVLEMDPDGLLTVYRNAVNGKDTESESAVGYVSLDRQMAWDYNSTRENIGANGRYEIDVKPDEVYGLLGYSQIEDEYGLTIGRGVTQQEGRVRRVGDLEPAKLAPWLEEWNSQFKRGQGSSPLRGFNIAGEYDFHEVEDFGENIQEFFSKYNLQASDVAAMFDKLHGEGAYARYKESGNTVSYQLIKKMFIKLENGNLGLNAEYLDSFNVLKPNAEYKDDQFDNIMKMLSTFQELTGQHFMTHKTRDYTPPKSTESPSGEPNYEGIDGVAPPGKWREHAIGEDETRTRKDNPGLKWDRYTAVVPISELSKFAEFDRNTQEKSSDSKDIIDSIAEELREGGVEALRDALWIKYDPENKWGVLVEGNHRLAAAIKAGITEIPVSITTGADLADNKNKNIGSRLDIDNRIVETTGYMPSDVHPGNFKQFEGYR